MYACTDSHSENRQEGYRDRVQYSYSGRGVHGYSTVTTKHLKTMATSEHLSPQSKKVYTLQRAGNGVAYMSPHTHMLTLFEALCTSQGG